MTPLIVAGAMLAGALYACAVGDDVNWDWRNYHAYNVWATLRGRYDIDVAPAGFQTYFNPLAYFPIYYLRQLLSPLATGLVTGAVHGLNLLVIYHLTRVLLGTAANTYCLFAAVLLAAAGPMTLSEVGTSFADITLSLPIIASLILVLVPDTPRPKHYLFAGVLMGAAVGLKLTNVVFALGLMMAVLAAARPLVALNCITIGGVIGGLITAGWWSSLLWRDFANPVFPLFGGFFPSPEMPRTNILDRQFIPRGWLDGLAYPFYWLAGNNRSSEYPFRDARFAVALVLCLVAICVRLKKACSIFTARDNQFLIFFAVSFTVWLTLFSIQRYIVALELLCGPLIVLLLFRILANAGLEGMLPGFGSAGNTVILVIAVAAAAWTQPGDWSRRAWSNPYTPQIPDRLAQPATYLLLDKPLGYIAPLLPPQSRFYHLADVALPTVPDGRLDHRIRDGLKNPLPGGIWEMHLRGTTIAPALLAPYGLMIDAAQTCATIEAADPGSAIEICPVIAR